MYQTKRTFIKPDMKVANLIFENPSILLLLEHFGLDIVVYNKNVTQICLDNKINQELFISIANLYNGFNPPTTALKYERPVLESILTFLKNSHDFYLCDKIPEISEFISKMYTQSQLTEVKLLEKFFAEYAEEVREHLEYEDKIAFPYFTVLMKNNTIGKTVETNFSLKEYRDHHTDIETKLADLKNLLLKHIELKIDAILKRKLLISLFELENDLNIHSVIEETILMPMIQELESQAFHG